METLSLYIQAPFFLKFFHSDQIALIFIYYRIWRISIRDEMKWGGCIYLESFFCLLQVSIPILIYHAISIPYYHVYHYLITYRATSNVMCFLCSVCVGTRSNTSQARNSQLKREGILLWMLVCINLQFFVIVSTSIEGRKVQIQKYSFYE